jgi:hypothetical protein
MNSSRMSMSTTSGQPRPSIAERAKNLIGNITNSNGPKVAALFPGGKMPLSPFIGNRNLLAQQ